MKPLCEDQAVMLGGEATDGFESPNTTSWYYHQNTETEIASNAGLAIPFFGFTIASWVVILK